MELGICPICGNYLAGGGYELRDGSVCLDCAEDLRFLYPLIYKTKDDLKKPDLSQIPFCQNLSLRDQRFLLKHIKEDSDLGNYDAATFTIDRMHLVTLEEFRSLTVQADALEDKIRANYFDYTNVCTAVRARPLCRTVGPVGIQNRRNRRRGFCIAGYIKTGRFSEGDLVTILHGEQTLYANILALGVETASVHPDGRDDRTAHAEALGDLGDQGVTLRAGRQVVMVLDETAAGVAPGDLIVTD